MNSGNLKLAMALGVALVLGGCGGTPEKDLDLPAGYQQIISDLKAGGVGVMLVHTTTSGREHDTDVVNLADCSRQRNLSEKGRREAKQIGESFKLLGVSVRNVVNSPFCRCKDTAQLAFGRHQDEPNLRSKARTRDIDVQRRVRWLKNAINGIQPGQVDVWVGHADLFAEVIRTNLKEGQAALIKRGDRGGFKVFAIVTAVQLASLGQAE